MAETGMAWPRATTAETVAALREIADAGKATAGDIDIIRRAADEVRHGHEDLNVTSSYSARRGLRVWHLCKRTADVERIGTTVMCGTSVSGPWIDQSEINPQANDWCQKCIAKAEAKRDKAAASLAEARSALGLIATSAASSTRDPA